MAGHIECCICTTPIPPDQYRTARCWSDPAGITCAAHGACLTRLGETDLGLRTDEDAGPGPVPRQVPGRP